MISIGAGAAAVKVCSMKLFIESSRELNFVLKVAVASSTTNEIRTLRLLSTVLNTIEFEEQNKKNEKEKKKDNRVKVVIVAMIEKPL